MGVVHRQVASADSPTWDYEHVPVEGYTCGSGGAASTGALRRVLVGPREGAGDFVIRYFVLPPGGHSALDQHIHQHGVVVIHGGGRVLLGETWHDLGVGDAVYIEPDEVHQLAAQADTPLGFICVIPSWVR